MKELEERFVKLKLVLDETIKFPEFYMFKFIVPKEKVDLILKVLDGMEIDQKESSNGKYISVSGKKEIQKSEEIILIYKNASAIKGIVSL